VDAQSGLVHKVLGTAANVADITQAGALLHGDCQGQSNFPHRGNSNFPTRLRTVVVV
jgi:hypothetical protein